jgi:hypothetical protein
VSKVLLHPRLEKIQIHTKLSKPIMNGDINIIKVFPVSLLPDVPSPKDDILQEERLSPNLLQL